MSNVDSIKAKLKNRAIKEKRTFQEAKKVKHVIDFKSVIDQIKDFLSPIVEMIEKSDQYNKSWKPSRCSWE